MIEKKLHNRQTETAVVVGIIKQEQSTEQVDEYLAELNFLARTAGAVVKKQFTQKRNFADKKTFVGSGKFFEIKTYVEENDIDTVIFDDELSPSQLRNIEQELKCKVLDRTNLILDIFASHARTAHAKTQVELAQYEYLMPDRKSVV